MMFVIRLLVLLGLIGIAAPSFGQQLWQASKVGMSVPEVQQAFPDAKPPEKGDRVYSGAKSLLEIRGVEIEGQQYVAKFFFLDDKLSQVNLSSHHGASAQETLQTFESLSEALRSKYGRELSREVTRSQLATIGTATWASGRTTISVFTSFISKTGLVSLSYSARLAATADKL